MPFDWTNTVVLPPPPSQHEQVVLELLDLDDHGLLPPCCATTYDTCASGDQGREHYDTFHTAPPGKKTRSTNQYAPASITTIEPANDEPPSGDLAARSNPDEQRRDEHDDDELADLDADVEREERPAQRAARQIHLAKHVREPEAVDQAERKGDPRARVAAAGADQQVVGAHVDDAERDGRLDGARRRDDHAQRRQRQRDAVRYRKRGDDQQQLLEGAAQQQQADEKQQMIGADQNVVHARRHELLEHRPAPPAGCP